VLVIEPHDGAKVTAQDVLDFLEGRIIKWWTPDAVEIDTVPLTATGKIDKKVLRVRYADRLRG
jgi:3-(methylthio)propionyl---CoA ligase